MAGDAPIVLDEQGRSPVVNVTGGIPSEKAAVSWRARKEVLDRRRSNGAVRGGEGAADKFEASARSTVGSATETIAVLFDAELNDVLSDRAGDVIHKLISVIGSLNFGPIESSDSGHRKAEKSENVDARQAPIKRVGNASA